MTTETQSIEAPDVVEELSHDARMVAALFISKMTHAGGNRLIKEINDSVSRLIKAGEFDRAKFALHLIDYLQPRIDEIVVQARKPQVKRAAPKAKKAA